MNQNLKIVALKAENIKKLVAVEIRPDGNVVELTGKNGQGKTSVLDAISWALEGAAVIQGEPIRKGQTKAWVTLDLGDIVVKRSFKKTEEGETTSSIVVESKEGARFQSPQAMLDGLLGKLAFDPLAFARMGAKDQFDTLKKFVAGVDFEAIEKENNSDFDKRTTLKRKAKELRAQQAAIAASEDGDIAIIDEADLVSQLEKAGAENASIETRRANRAAVATQIETLRDDLESVMTRANAEAERIVNEAKAFADKMLSEARTKSTQLTATIADLTAKLNTAPPLPEPTDLALLREQINAARETNRVRSDRSRKIAFRDEADRLEAQASGMTEAIEAREKAKRDAVAAAKLPVDGVTFGAGSILMNGVPFDQASDAEQLRASIAIAMSLNPKLRVIRVRDGSLLDRSSMELLSSMAKERDYQVWVETCHNDGQQAIVMEDGHARVQSAEPVPV